MSGLLDTPMVVRYLTGDPPTLANLSAEVIDGQEALFLTDVVIAETFYVLRSQYNVAREAAIESLVALLRKENVTPLHCSRETTIEALLMCRDSGRVAIADALVWASAHCSGRRVVYSLDRRFPADGLDVRQRVL